MESAYRFPGLTLKGIRRSILSTEEADRDVGRPCPKNPRYRRGILLVMAAGRFCSLGGILVRLIEAAGPWRILLIRSLTVVVLGPIRVWLWIGEEPRLWTLIGACPNDRFDTIK